jgi:putative transposase
VDERIKEKSISDRYIFQREKQKGGYAQMNNNNIIEIGSRVEYESKTGLEKIIRDGARKMLQAAIENEVNEYIEWNKELIDKEGKRLVVRNGSMPEREIITGVGRIGIKQPRVNDKRPGEKYTSNILPPYMRRVRSLDALIPALYLKGISTGDMYEALETILGKKAAGLSATNVVRLKNLWKQEYEEWNHRGLSGKKYVYLWADGIHFNVRLEDDRACILVIMGTLEDGTKELIAAHAGYRESKLSWLEILQDMKRRGLKHSPKLAVGDGALGFWAAISQEYPETRHQRCWVHKTANVLDKMPKSVQPNAKNMIHEMYLSPTKKDALGAYDAFMKLYSAKYPKACECLEKDKDILFTFYDFPAEHWPHVRTTNPIESTFATVRLRTKRTKGCGSREATLTMVFMLCMQAQKHWRRINGHKLILKLFEGVVFIDGIEKVAA